MTPPPVVWVVIGEKGEAVDVVGLRANVLVAAIDRQPCTVHRYVLDNKKAKRRGR